MIGQIQITHIADVDAARARSRAAAPELLADARRLVPRLAERGGGPVALEPRVLARSGPDGGVIVVAPPRRLPRRDGREPRQHAVRGARRSRRARSRAAAPGLRILSNLTDGRTVTVRCFVADALLADDGDDGADVREAIAAASRFAELDPYRARDAQQGHHERRRRRARRDRPGLARGRSRRARVSPRAPARTRRSRCGASGRRAASPASS